MNPKTERLILMIAAIAIAIFIYARCYFSITPMKDNYNTYAAASGMPSYALLMIMDLLIAILLVMTVYKLLTRNVECGEKVTIGFRGSIAVLMIFFGYLLDSWHDTLASVATSTVRRSDFVIPIGGTNVIGYGTVLLIGCMTCLAGIALLAVSHTKSPVYLVILMAWMFCLTVAWIYQPSSTWPRKVAEKSLTG